MAKTIKDLKPEEKDEILSYIDLEDFDNFSEQFNKKYFTKDTALSSDEIKKTILGKRMTEIESVVLKIGKIVNPELTRAKNSEKQVEENLEEIAGLFTNKLSELETRSKSGNDKRVNDLEKEIEDKNKSLLSYKELAEKEAKEKEDIRNSMTSEMKNFKLNHEYEQLKNKLQWIDNATDIDRLGFDTLIKSKYKIDLSDKDEIQILTSDGKPIPSKVKGGQMADPYEILDMELEVNKKKKLNNAKDQKSFISLTNPTERTDRPMPQQYLNRLKK